MVARLSSTLRATRARRGLPQSALAGMAGISRQSYSAIEDGSSTPSTEVALRLARALGSTVEALFQLAEDAPAQVEAEWLGPRPDRPARVRINHVAGRTFARPLEGGGPRGLAVADGLASLDHEGRIAIRPLGERSSRPTAVALGCDPAVTVLAAGLARDRGVDLVATEAGSRQALEGLARGEAHLAGCHLLDEETGLYNLPWVQRLVHFPCTLVGFAVWEQGLAVAPGNPLRLAELADLARPGLRFVNRELGSGSRALLDTQLQRHAIPSELISGYDRAVSGHLAVAEAVASGFADAGVAVRAAAVAYGLDFVELGEERYDLVIPDHFLELPAIVALIDYLGGRQIRAQVEALGGYDSTVMGLPA